MNGIPYTPSGQSVIAKNYGSLEDALAASDPAWLNTKTGTTLWARLTSYKGNPRKATVLLIQTDQSIQIKLNSTDDDAITVDDVNWFNLSGIEFSNLFIKTTVETNVRIIIY